jgi:hypothetical protein
MIAPTEERKRQIIDEEPRGCGLAPAGLWKSLPVTAATVRSRPELNRLARLRNALAKVHERITSWIVDAGHQRVQGVFEPDQHARYEFGLIHRPLHVRAESRKPASFAVALYCGIGSSSLKALVNAFDRLHIVRGWNSAYRGLK